MEQESNKEIYLMEFVYFIRNIIFEYMLKVIVEKFSLIKQCISKFYETNIDEMFMLLFKRQIV